MSKVLTFPKDFIWGTSTAAAQIETASDHIWNGVKAIDGSILNDTIAHEKQRSEDAKLINGLGSIYRAGVDWARLQKAPYEAFDKRVVKEYQDFFQELNDQGQQVLFVLHHFTHPNWFESAGGFAKRKNIPVFMNYVEQCIDCFAAYTSNWNTFNEPNVFVMNAYILGGFPPFKKNYFLANKVLSIMGQAHDQAYDLLKKKQANKPVGISYNTAIFRGLNLLGNIAAKFTDWWFNNKAASYFERSDYWGISYYALVLFDPKSITETERPGKLADLGYKHDKMWAYYPQGLSEMILHFHKKYKKPILITENGICSDSPLARIESIKDYLQECHTLISNGVNLIGYIHWSTFDNFEWHLGNTYQFGLISVDMKTKERKLTEAATFYKDICKSNSVEI